MAAAGADAYLTAQLQRAKPNGQVLSDWERCCDCKDWTCLCPQVFLGLPCWLKSTMPLSAGGEEVYPGRAASGSGSREVWQRPGSEHMCIPVLRASKATQAILCNDQMIIPPIMTPKIREELDASKDRGRQELEKTVWVIPAVSMNLVLVLHIYRLTAGVSGSSSVRGAGVKNVWYILFPLGRLFCMG